VPTRVKAFSPSGISSFFEICDTTESGKPILNPERVGARGGGFVTEKGVMTEVSISSAERNTVEVFINEKLAPEAETTRTVAETLLQRSGEKHAVIVRHKVEVPVGAGFGSSAGGALGTALALSKALGLDCTYNELGRIAHSAEVKCKTGLGTVGPLMMGGCILTLEPGAPGRAVIDRIPLSPDTVVVAGVLGGIPTKSVLSSPQKRAAVSKTGRKTLERILSDPSLENFLVCCRDFAEETGFMTEKLRNLVKLAEKAGAIGAAQNMVGEVIHAVTTSENVQNLVQAFKQVLTQNEIIVAKIDFQGARLLG
jgi:pantoate kinase